jgi:hypothetical protein
MRLLRSLFLHNLHLKLIALAISFFFWATYTAQPFEQVSYNVAISYLNVPEGLVVGGSPPNTVRVVLRGRSGLIRHVMPGDLTIGVDLSTAPSGDVPIRLFPGMVDTPFGTEVVGVAPAQFDIALVRVKKPPEASE